MLRCKYTYAEMLRAMNDVNMSEGERETVAAVICEVVKDPSLDVVDVLREADALKAIEER